jgi:hypothetical protein
VAITIPNLLLIGVALMSRPTPVQSTDAALPRPALVKLLGDSYAEVPAVSGLAQNGRLIESFAQSMARNRKHQAPERNISPPSPPSMRSEGNAP